MYTIGIGLVVLVVAAAVAWYYLGSRQAASSAPLENMARVNEATIGGHPPMNEVVQPEHEPQPQAEDEHAHAE